MLNLEHTCSTRRNVPVGTNGRHEVQDHLNDIRCLFLPLTTRATVENGFSLGRGYEVFFDTATDVKPGDRLTRNGLSYTVRHVQNFDTNPIIAHLHAYAEQDVS